MKPYNKALVDFMEFKKKKIGMKKYFDERDAKYLMRLDTDVAKKIWEDLLLLCNSTEGVGGLRYRTCPFCYLAKKNHTRDCKKCVYRKHHGECFSRSEANDLLTWVRRKENKIKGTFHFSGALQNDDVKNFLMTRNGRI